jgi:hypothetical protein
MTTKSFANHGMMLEDFAQFDLAQEVLASGQNENKPWQTGHTART